ncbi:hypothetical protein HDU97_005359 [Phlyctochytrium planicorne]|nr:hypothetical protein HDU97_005359 [Phlyctochytrium planicorne]
MSSGNDQRSDAAVDEIIERRLRDEAKRLRQKAVAEARLGPGGYERAQLKIKPHRCSGHIEDLSIGLTSWPMDVREPFMLVWKCMWSKEGEEPARLFKEPTEFIKGKPDSHPFFKQHDLPKSTSSSSSPSSSSS